MDLFYKNPLLQIRKFPIAMAEATVNGENCFVINTNLLKLSLF